MRCRHVPVWFLGWVCASGILPVWGQYEHDTTPRHKVETNELSEASGMAVSREVRRRYWAIEDSGHKAELHLFDNKGKDMGSVRVKGARNTDWESLASFRMDGVSYLLVADIGDNFSSRDDGCRLYVVREPSEEQARKHDEVDVEWRVEFTYQDGPRDCEAVAVDMTREKIMLVTKRTDPAEYYELPLRPDKEAKSPLVIEKLGEVRVNAPEGSWVPFRNQPTGMDVSADGTKAVICTYYGVFLFEKEKPGDEWVKVLAGEPKWSWPHALGQAEAVAFSQSADAIYVISEGKHSPIARYFNE